MGVRTHGERAPHLVWLDPDNTTEAQLCNAATDYDATANVTGWTHEAGDDGYGELGGLHGALFVKGEHSVVVVCLNTVTGDGPFLACSENRADVLALAKDLDIQETDVLADQTVAQTD